MSATAVTLPEPAVETAHAAPPASPGKPSALHARLALAAVLLVSTAVIIAASRQTSPTFDEIVLIAGGARGYEYGRFELAPDHPPLMQYIYGLPAWLARPNYPDETQVPPDIIGSMGYRYQYAQHFFWRAGNDPERMAALGRLPAAIIAAVLVLLVYGYVSRRWDAWTGLLAAGLTAFLPDVLAHGGVAYNDVPLAAAFFGAVWAFDAAARRPGVRTGLVAGIALGLALGVKVSAVILLPVAALIAASEWIARGRDRAWFTALAVALPVAAAGAYLTLVAIYLGDWTLEGIRYAVAFQGRHAARGHGAAAFLLGNRSSTGWWYFFPVVFFLKTSAALHLLLLLAVIHHVRSASRNLRRLLASPLRAPLMAMAVFTMVLIGTRLNIGFRYALPVLPLVVVVIAPGVAAWWRQIPRGRLRLALAGVVLWAVAQPLSYHPNHLTYVSEYGPGRRYNHEVLVDSSLDWGQGLLQLRRYLESQGNPRIYLSYFGSALPEGYGIDYIPLAGFFPLHRQVAPDSARPPRLLVVSATNLQGAYFTNDVFADLRKQEPERVIAGSMLVYRLPEGE